MDIKPFEFCMKALAFFWLVYGSSGQLRTWTTLKSQKPWTFLFGIWHVIFFQCFRWTTLVSWFWSKQTSLVMFLLNMEVMVGRMKYASCSSHIQNIAFIIFLDDVITFQKYIYDTKIPSTFVDNTAIISSNALGCFGIQLSVMECIEVAPIL
jgi:hypothetical protein